MLNARYLANLSDDLIELYGELEYFIKKDIFKRLNKLKAVTDATTYQATILNQVGGLNLDIQKLLKEYDESARVELTKLYVDAMNTAKKNDLRFYAAANRELSKSKTQILNATIDRLDPDALHPVNLIYAKVAGSPEFEQIYSNLIRMTATVADESQKAFLKAANNAYMKVSTGATSWEKAYKDAVIDIAKNGAKVRTVTKGGNIVNTSAPIVYNTSGTIRLFSLESAVRMNILTGINQTASQQTLETADELGTDLVEVSAHIGARPLHEELQGKVYCTNGEREYIAADGIKRIAPDFYKTCRIGEPDGICGINCRHSFYPYFEGTPLQYSNGQLSEMADKKVTLNGDRVTPYEAEQELRVCERNIRYYKSICAGLENVGKDEPEYISAANNLYNWQKDAQRISKETGIKRNYTNEFIGTADGKQPRGLKPKN